MPLREIWEGIQIFNVIKVNKPVWKAAMMLWLQRQLMLLAVNTERVRMAHEGLSLSSRSSHVILSPSPPARHNKNASQNSIFASTLISRYFKNWDRLNISVFSWDLIHANTVRQLTLDQAIDLPLNHPLPSRTHNTAYPGVDYAEGKRS
jgi:hypothetical protein